jgi:soluble lytic murein transglycosylase
VIRLTTLSALAAAVTAVACVDGASSDRHARFDALDAAFAARRSNPTKSVELFAAAGVGPTLERVRLEAWFDGLERIGAEPAEWRRLLAAGPPPDIEGRAELELAKALEGTGEIDGAVAALEGAPPLVRNRADEFLMQLGNGPWQEVAARRLAVRAPNLLRRSGSQLEPGVVAALQPAERLERSAAWRAVGWPRTAAAELRGARWSGELERLRRLEVARADVEAGAPSRALGLLRSGPRGDAEWQLLRATAYRRQGWQRTPRSTARSSFLRCSEAARQSASDAGEDEMTRIAALELALECGTEAQRLDEALSAWRRLEMTGWTSDRRDWLGRRLGVALAQDGRDTEVVVGLASALPRHARCLRFWAASTSAEDGDELEELAGAGFADLYGLWSRRQLGVQPATEPAMGGDIGPAGPPSAVAWLVDRDALAEAATEWRRIRSRRGSWPAEGVAAAELAAAVGRPNEAIGWLRSAVPELGTVRMDRAPANAVRAYLPLRWAPAIREAARESGLDPWLLAGVARQESVFIPYARSARGAEGVLQLIPDTARGHARALGLGRNPDLFDPEVNLRIGARELRHLVDRFGAIEPALAAYNAGESRARRWWRRWPDVQSFTEAVPIPETYNYIRRVSYLAEAYRIVYQEEWRSNP